MEFDDLQDPGATSHEVVYTTMWDHTFIIERHGHSLLMRAKEGNVEATQELINRGAPFSVDRWGNSGLHWAAKENQILTAELLLKAGISPSQKNFKLITPLHLAAKEGHTEIVNLLLAYGADPNVYDRLKMVPLHLAIRNDHVGCVKLLLEYCSDPYAADGRGKIPYQMAFNKDRHEICQLLRDNSWRVLKGMEAKKHQEKLGEEYKALREKQLKKEASKKAIEDKEKVKAPNEE